MRKSLLAVGLSAVVIGSLFADNHLYEASDAFTRHLPEQRRRDFYWVTDERGHRLIVVGNRVWDYIVNPTFDPVAVSAGLDVTVTPSMRLSVAPDITASNSECRAGDVV